MANCSQHGLYPVGAKGRRTGKVKAQYKKLTDLRNRISVEFMSDLMDDYEVGGKRAIEILRTTDPVNYCRLIATMVPRKLDVSVDQHKTIEIRGLAEVRDALIGATRQGLTLVPELPALPGTHEHVLSAALPDDAEGRGTPVDLGEV